MTSTCGVINFIVDPGVLDEMYIFVCAGVLQHLGSIHTRYLVDHLG